MGRVKKRNREKKGGNGKAERLRGEGGGEASCWVGEKFERIL